MTIDYKNNCVKVFTIGDAWREAMSLCVRNGYDYVVEGGSYVGQIRRQLEDVKITITHPYIRPLAPIMPPNVPGPTSDEKIEKYFAMKLMNNITEGNEQYTYGMYIAPQLPKIIDILIASRGHTNQACISIGDEESVYLPDPPCLRAISFKVVNGRLNMSVFFRSWDLYAGLPENLGGLQLVKEYVRAHVMCEFEADDGHIIAYSDGLHLYEQYFGLANQLNVDKIEVSEDLKAEKEALTKVLAGVYL